MGSRVDKVMFAVFVLGASVISLMYGYVSFAYKLFPYEVFRQAVAAYREIAADNASFEKARFTPEEIIPPEPSAAPGLTLMTMINKDDMMNIKVVDPQGQSVYDRTIDWFEVWPDPAHLIKEEDQIEDSGSDLIQLGAMPKTRPGTHIHGIALMDNGDFVFNFEHLGLVRINSCGVPVWRLPYRTHHSVFVNDDQTIWVPGQINHYQTSPKYPNYTPPFIEFTVLQVSADGKILTEYSIFDLLKKNDLSGLLYLSNLANRRTDASGNTLHLNDVEPFRPSLREGYFKKGDIMISLRNINAVLVFEPVTGKVKFSNVGSFVRQHDPDFIDGDTISIFDNNNLSPGDKAPRSRIVVDRPATGSREVYYDGDGRRVFYTSIAGKHQWLPNGNLLVTESQAGRAFELDKDRKIVWEFVNFVGDGMVGLMEEATRLDPKFDQAFFSSRAAAC